MSQDHLCQYRNHYLTLIGRFSPDPRGLTERKLHLRTALFLHPDVEAPLANESAVLSQEIAHESSVAASAEQPSKINRETEADGVASWFHNRSDTRPTRQ
jgi:hypothetical protein